MIIIEFIIIWKLGIWRRIVNQGGTSCDWNSVDQGQREGAIQEGMEPYENREEISVALWFRIGDPDSPLCQGAPTCYNWSQVSL